MYDFQAPWFDDAKLGLPVLAPMLEAAPPCVETLRDMAAESLLLKFLAKTTGVHCRIYCWEEHWSVGPGDAHQAPQQGKRLYHEG